MQKRSTEEGMNYEERLEIDTHGVLFCFLYSTWLCLDLWCGRGRHWRWSSVNWDLGRSLALYIFHFAETRPEGLNRRVMSNNKGE